MTAELHTSRSDCTLIIAISDPETRNELHPDMVAAAIEIVSTAERDESVLAIVLTGAGNVFSSGTNLHHLLENRVQDKATQIDATDNLHNLMEAVRNCTKPIIAAVEGAAIGSGFSLALSCDMIVASASAIFMISNIGLGMTPDGGGSWLVTRVLPRQLATEVLTTGKAISAERLHALGIVNYVVAEGTTLETALALADEISRLPCEAVEATRSLIQDASNHTLAQHFGTEKHHFIESLHHWNAQEGISAFFDKRKPRFQ